MAVDAQQAHATLSVVLVVKDAVATIERAIDSVLAQTGSGIELIVVDGASNDGTLDLLERRGGRFAQLISEPDDGIADAMNKGLAASSGDWVYFLGAEDRLARDDCLAEMLQVAAECHGDIVAGSVLIEDAPGVLRRLEPRGCTFGANFKTPLLHQGTLCRRRLFERNGSFDQHLKIAMDYDFFLRACRVRATVCRIDQVVAVMDGSGIGSRTDWASLSRRFDEERLVHLRHCDSAGLRIVYALYHPLYRLYRRLRSWGRR